MAKSKKYQPAGKKGTKHFSITVPNEMLAKIDAAAKKKGISRSYLTTMALQQYLGRKPYQTVKE